MGLPKHNFHKVIHHCMFYPLIESGAGLKQVG